MESARVGTLWVSTSWWFSNVVCGKSYSQSPETILASWGSTLSLADQLHNGVECAKWKYTIINIDFASHYCASHEESANISPNLMTDTVRYTTGGNPNIMTHSCPKHCVWVVSGWNHTQKATILYHKTRRWPHSLLAILLAGIKRGVIERGVPGVDKTWHWRNQPQLSQHARMPWINTAVIVYIHRKIFKFSAIWTHTRSIRKQSCCV